MIRFQWQILDDIANYEFTFDPKTEDLEIYGQFELCSNDEKIGNYFDIPEKNRFKIYGDEDILLVLKQFKTEVIPLEDGEETDILFLQDCCFHYFFMAREKNMLILKKYDKETKHLKQTIKMDRAEFIVETERNIKLFVDYIHQQNPSLLENETVKWLNESNL